MNANLLSHDDLCDASSDACADLIDQAANTAVAPQSMKLFAVDPLRAGSGRRVASASKRWAPHLGEDVSQQSLAHMWFQDDIRILINPLDDSRSRGLVAPSQLPDPTPARSRRRRR